METVDSEWHLRDANIIYFTYGTERWSSLVLYFTLFNPFVRKFLGRQRPLKILPTKNLFLGINLDSMMSKIDLDCFGIHKIEASPHSVTENHISY